MKITLIIVPLLLLLQTGSAAEGTGSEKKQSREEKALPDNILKLEEAIKIALHANPSLKSFESRWKASSAAVPQAGAWTDPVIRFSLMNLPSTTYAFDEEPMTGKQLTLMQRVPFPGKLSAKKAAMGYESSARENEYLELSNKIISEVKQVYYDLFYFYRAVRITDNNRGILSSFVDIAQTKFSVGRGIQQDVLRAKVELSKMDEKLVTFKRIKMTLKTKLNTLMDRPAHTQINKIEEILKTSHDYSEESLLLKAKKARPMLKAASDRISSKEEMLKNARRNYFPDFNIGVSYTQREELSASGLSGVDFLSASVGITIPLYKGSKQSKRVEEIRALQRMNEEMYSALLNEIEFEIRDLLLRSEEKAELLDLFDNSIIPQAELSLNSAISGYQVGKVDFLTLLDNEIILFNYQLKRYRILVDHEKILAILETTVGELLF